MAVCLTNPKDGTAAKDVSVYMKDSNQCSLDLGEHLPRFEQQKECNDLNPCHQSIGWWVVVAGEWCYYRILKRGCDIGRRGYWFILNHKNSVVAVGPERRRVPNIDREVGEMHGTNQILTLLEMLSAATIFENSVQG